jgi:hypothetical protein
MELYFKNASGHIEKTSLFYVLYSALSEFNTQTGEDYLAVTQETDSVQVEINFEFKDNNTIEGLHVFEAPIRKIVDTDNQRRVI